ncbi:rhomboid family intramembrane serine protease [Microbacterium sp. SORGH_AS_0888]|uniref:rhomboid family intramembrane serine protease n=1 Tax=Microbacterium sp. SORGH_AS_0888 TaxID=3041791 RepID=UPI00277E8E5A|nr:rhomboid family intramembrane serine protease [Microbacterium sp. SORGH_AS_0888]MDQ1130003.1 membrane associated rhomboid family serine protease [Microbacterium sp. SORGH_AS_0888]
MTTPEFTRNRENYCYRHPDRQSFVLCQRCLRTICPECQTPAAVGVICPECMAEQRREQTPAQRRAERRWSRSAPVAAVSSGQPVVTYTVIAICFGVYVLQLVLGPQVGQWLLFSAGYLYPQITGVFEPWRLLTSAFAHSSFWHVGLNMLSLWMIGRILEPLLGRGRFLALYLLSAIGGSVGVALLAPSSAVVGASGAIFGLFGALVIIARHLGANLAGILIVVGINLAIGFVPGMGISWQAHVGGLVTGALVGLVLARTRRRDQRALQIGLLAGLGIVLLLLLLLPPVIYG